MEIAIDFDGTVVQHEYPNVGATVMGSVETIKRLVENGHRIILWTMRSDKYLQDAIDWYLANGIPLYGVNSNPTQKEWTNSPKAYAQLYIDDAAFGCPLLQTTGRPFANWTRIAFELERAGVISAENGSKTAQISTISPNGVQDKG